MNKRIVAGITAVVLTLMSVIFTVGAAGTDNFGDFAWLQDTGDVDNDFPYKETWPYGNEYEPTPDTGEEIVVASQTLDAQNKDSQGIKYTLNETNNTAVVGDSSANACNSGYSGAASGVVAIPSKVVKNGVEYTVTEIGYYAFRQCTELVSITISSTVRTIANCAFFDCTGLETVTIGFGLRKIGASAFAGCTSLSTVNLVSSINQIGYSAFYNCDALDTIAIPSAVTEIGNKTFASCETLRWVTLPQNLTSVGDEAFAGCPALKNISIPQYVESLGDAAFGNCTGLEVVLMYDSVDSFGNGVFFNCPNLVVCLPENASAAITYLDNNNIDYIFKGDANGDGIVNISDAILLAQYIASNGMIEMSNTAADISRDENINIADVIKLKQYIAARDTIILD